jgi:hypothetical protein
MLTSRKSSDKPLKSREEPQQLELFGSAPRPESAAAVDPVCPAVCDKIAAEMCQFYKLDADHSAALEQYVCAMDASRVVLESAQAALKPSAELRTALESFQRALQPSTALSDYVKGIASTMNFFPVPTEQTFVRSDLIAMASDWNKVQSDLNRIWGAITAAERFCHDRSGQQQKRRQAAHAE